MLLTLDDIYPVIETEPHRRHASFEAAAAALQQVLSWEKVKKRFGQISPSNLNLLKKSVVEQLDSTEIPAPVVIYSISDMRTVLAAAEENGCGAAIITAPGIASTLGPRWFTAMLARLQDEYTETPLLAIMDCGDREGVAMAALQHGVQAIYFQGNPASTQKLQWMARKVNAHFFNKLGPTLDLLEQADAYLSCSDWLKQHGIPIPEAEAIA